MIRRGDVLLADLAPVVGREQSGLRPVVVVSTDAINELPLVVTVVPGTSADRVARDYATNVRVTAAESGLRRDTVFLCFQVRSLDPARFSDGTTGKVRKVGVLPDARMSEVSAALRRVLAL